MNEHDTTTAAAALAAIAPDDALLAAGQALTGDACQLVGLAATPDEIGEIISGVADTLLVCRDRACESISDGSAGWITGLLAEGPDALAAEMLAWDADPEVDCQVLLRTLILRSQGRRTDEGYWDSEASADAVAFEEAFDDGIARTGTLIHNAAMIFFGTAAISSGWKPANQPDK